MSRPRRPSPFLLTIFCGLGVASLFGGVFAYRVVNERAMRPTEKVDDGKMTVAGRVVGVGPNAAGFVAAFSGEKHEGRLLITLRDEKGIEYVCEFGPGSEDRYGGTLDGEPLVARGRHHSTTPDGRLVVLVDCELVSGRAEPLAVPTGR